MKVIHWLFAPFKTISSIDIEDVVVILRIICGGAMIALIFQMQPLGLYVAVYCCVLIKFIRYYLCKKEEKHD